MNDSNQWYVAVGDSSVGPVPTELVVRGIEQRKVSADAHVCAVGESTWLTLSAVPVFHEAVVTSYPPPPPESEDARYWLGLGFRFPGPAPVPTFGSPLRQFDAALASALKTRAPSSPVLASIPNRTSSPDLSASPAIAPAPLTKAAPGVQAAPSLAVAGSAEPDVAHAGRPLTDDLGIDVDIDADAHATTLDWSQSFHSYFLVDSDVVLPDEHVLLKSLSIVPPDTFRHDEAMWNLALCLAYGSDDVGKAAATVFFDAVTSHGKVERVDWMSRTLLSRGFVPSGIPSQAGLRAVERLRSLCPRALASDLDRGIG